jgi:hypothetical protein
MKKIALLIIALVFIATGISFAANDTLETTYYAFTPDPTAPSVLLKSGDKQYKYYVIQKGTSFGFDIVGPNEIDISTRAELKTGVDVPEYEIQVWEADRLVESRKVTSKPSMLTLANQKVGVGVSRDAIFVVSPGKHSYRLWITSDKTDKYYARFYQTIKPAPKAGYHSFKPTVFQKEITLVTPKKTYTYYLVDNKNDATLSITGPAKLRIFCRVNFSKDMKKRAKFTLGMYENGREITQFPGVAKMSITLQFKELGDMVPSTLCTFAYDIPAGKHVYELKKINSTSSSLAVRFEIMTAGSGIVP